MYTLSLHDALPIYLKTPGRPRTPWDFWGEIAAAETPHGASLQWGAPAVETDKLTPMGGTGRAGPRGTAGAPGFLSNDYSQRMNVGSACRVGRLGWSVTGL